MEPARQPLPRETILAAFEELKGLVSSDLRLQQGDSARLNARKNDCTRLLSLASQHAVLFTAEENGLIRTSLNDMITHLDRAIHQSADPPEDDFIPVVHTHRTGRPGRPRRVIDPEFLTVAYSLRGPTHLGQALGMHPRSVRRQILDLNLAEPGEPVYVDYVHEDDTVTRIYRSSTAAVSDIPDDELDTIVLHILEAFPGYGRRMLTGHLRHLGHQIPRSRLQASYRRVHGAPPQGFGPRRIQRRVYNVPGPNALWHHDGQHGLIRWKFVIHAFIDGFSRFVTGIQVSSNNTAATVLDVFVDAIDMHGIPSRVRGDYGTENMLVAALMEELKGIERGSYIWGRSVHNVRIERLWRDITLAFGNKWKVFFETLEAQHGLNPNLNAHIWLLHYLFSDAINRDAMEWAEAWNSHTLTIHSQRSRSPRDMFVFGMLEHGVRGIQGALHDQSMSVPDIDLPAEEIQAYGIDWSDMDDPAIHTHHNLHNRDSNGEFEGNPFLTHPPHHFSHVAVDTPEPPYHDEELLQRLDEELQELPAFNERTMDSYRTVWIAGLGLCTQFSESHSNGNIV